MKWTELDLKVVIAHKNTCLEKEMYVEAFLWREWQEEIEKELQRVKFQSSDMYFLWGYAKYTKYNIKPFDNLILFNHN